MKKPSKKQDVFRASQKSFFFAFLERSGTVPEKVMIFDESSMQKLLEFLHCFFILFVRFRKVPNAI